MANITINDLIERSNIDNGYFIVDDGFTTYKISANNLANQLRLASTYPKVYSATGQLVNGSGVGVTGYGTFTATFFETGIVRVDFGLMIETVQSSSSFQFGLSSALLSALVPEMPTITPTNFAGSFTYYNTSGAIDTSLTGYGGMACNPTTSGYWGFGRTYNVSGNRGGYPASSMYVGMKIVGSVYGTFEV